MRIPNHPMQRQLDITTEPIQEAQLIARRAMSGGWGRPFVSPVLFAPRGDKSIRAIEYEAFQRMARINSTFCSMKWKALAHRVRPSRPSHRRGESQRTLALGGSHRAPSR